jgi:integrase
MTRNLHKTYTFFLNPEQKHTFKAPTKHEHFMSEKEQPNSPAPAPKKCKRVKGVTIFPVTIKGIKYWRVVSPKSGKRRIMRTFKDHLEARNYYQMQVTLTRNLGRASGGLSAKGRLDAIAALEALAPFDGVSLVSAVEFYARHHVSLDESVTVQEAVAKFLAAKAADGMSERYLRDLRNRLSRFAEDFGDRKIADIGSPEVGSWLRSLMLRPLTRNTFHLRLHVLFAFAAEQHWTAKNPVQKSMRAKVVSPEPGILTPEQFAALLTHASDETRPYWLLGGFCGLRSAELERLEWRDIDWEHRPPLVEVNPAKSKTASRRHVDICDALLAWLRPYRGNTGRIVPIGLQRRLLADRKRAGIASWPSNGLRHSFASYHLARHNDQGKLAAQMGHMNSAMTYRHYFQRVKPAAAEVWWSIVPESPSNVLKIA